MGSTGQKNKKTEKPVDAGNARDYRKVLGKSGEDAAAAWLVAKGMQILERNFRCKIGELDIIGEMDGMLVFVEVRGRSSDRWGIAAESVDFRKRRKIRQLASYYMLQRGRAKDMCRFDVVSLSYGPSGRTEGIEWFPDAF